MTSQPPQDDTRRPATLDLPLILEQLQDQLDHLQAAVEAQQTVIEQYAARLAALERGRPQ